MFASLVFNPSPWMRGVQMLLYWMLLVLSGKKNNALITISVIAGIVFFNLLTPYGEVLYQIGVFKITKGALLAGLNRAFTLEALILLSRLTIRPGLRLPGRLGALVSDSLALLPRLQQVHIKTLVRDLDTLLCQMSTTKETADTPPAPRPEPTQPAAHTNTRGWVLAAGAVAASWALFVIGVVS
jgi:heptaprenyl diphosphate synthase